MKRRGDDSSVASNLWNLEEARTNDEQNRESTVEMQTTL
jgi:hypothetical protein